MERISNRSLTSSRTLSLHFVEGAWGVRTVPLANGSIEPAQPRESDHALALAPSTQSKSKNPRPVTALPTEWLPPINERDLELPHSTSWRIHWRAESEEPIPSRHPRTSGTATRLRGPDSLLCLRLGLGCTTRATAWHLAAGILRAAKRRFRRAHPQHALLHHPARS